MTALRQRMLEDMQPRGLAERTQEAYLSAVQQLALHYGKSPDLITEEEPASFNEDYVAAARDMNPSFIRPPTEHRPYLHSLLYDLELERMFYRPRLYLMKKPSLAKMHFRYILKLPSV